MFGMFRGLMFGGLLCTGGSVMQGGLMPLEIGDLWSSTM